MIIGLTFDGAQDEKQIREQRNPRHGNDQFLSVGEPEKTPRQDYSAVAVTTGSLTKSTTNPYLKACVCTLET